MAESGNRVWLIIGLVVFVLLAAVGVASGLIAALGDWENHRWGLTLASRTLWGTWVVAAAAVILTRATVMGWSFRRYFRWEGEGEPPPDAPRPTRAIWYKSPAASFGFTVTMVALAGSVIVSTVVLWILYGVGVIGPDVFWLVIKIIWGSWWVVIIALVVARVSVFGIHRSRVVKAAEEQS